MFILAVNEGVSVLKDYNKEIGEAVRRARKSATITQEELADRAGISRPSITNIESGRQQLTVNQLYVLSRALGVPPVSLLPETPASTSSAEVVVETLSKKHPNQVSWAEKLVAPRL